MGWGKAGVLWKYRGFLAGKVREIFVKNDGGFAENNRETPGYAPGVSLFWGQIKFFEKIARGKIPCGAA